MKKITVFFFVVVFATTLYGQKLEIKKDIVYVDGIECLRINDSDPNNISILDKSGKEIIFVKYSYTPTTHEKVTFLEQELAFTTKEHIFTIKILLKKLVEDGTLSSCNLNPEKVKLFVLKYSP